jgi:hypothetical protein
MPRNDFVCDKCDESATFWQSQFGSRPVCPVCSAVMAFAPQPGSYSIDAYEPGQEFTVDVNGRQVKVESLAQIRAIERQTEQAYRNGEGAPLVWRDYSQNRSNVDQHTLARDLGRPVDGYAEGTTGVDAKKFRPAKGADVIRQHGEA